MDAERRAFIEGIREDPEDDIPRLIFADWLDEQADPLGEFIRVQCELAQRSVADDPARFQQLRQREAELLKLHEQTWAGKIIGRVDGYHFERGLIERLSLDVDTLLKDGPELILATPGLATLRISQATGRVKEFIDLPEMNRPRRILFTQYPLRVDDVRALGTSTQLSNLKGLKLAGCINNVTVLESLGTLKNLPSLTELALSGTHLGNPAFDAFSVGSLISQIEQLEVSNCDLSSRSLLALLSGMPTERVRLLKLNGNSFGKRVMQKIAKFKNLKHLECRQKTFDIQCLTSLVDSSKQGQLKFLSIGGLGYNAPTLDSTTVAAMTRSSLCAQVETLIFGFEIDSEAFQEFLHPDRLPALRSLNIQYSLLTGKDLDLLAESGKMQQLNALHLGSLRDVKRDGLMRFIKASGWEKNSKRHLNLQSFNERRGKDYKKVCQYLGIENIF